MDSEPTYPTDYKPRNLLDRIPRTELVDGIRVSISVGMHRYGVLLARDTDPAEVAAMVQRTLENVPKVRYEHDEYPEDPMSK